MKKKTKKSTVSVPETLASNWSENIPDGTETKAFDVDLHYDDRGGSYYRRDDRGNYIKAKDGDARRYLAENPSKFDPRDYLKPAREAAKKICLARFEAFGTAGNASKIKAIPLDKMAERYARGELNQIVR